MLSVLLLSLSLSSVGSPTCCAHPDTCVLACAALWNKPSPHRSDLSVSLFSQRPTFKSPLREGMTRQQLASVAKLLESQVLELEARLVNAESERVACVDAVTQLESDLNKELETVSASSEAIDRAEGEVRRLGKQLKSERRAVAAAQDTITELEATNRELVERLADKDAELKQSRVANVGSTGLAKQVAQAKEHARDLQRTHTEELHALRTQHERARDELKKQLKLHQSATLRADVRQYGVQLGVCVLWRCFVLRALCCCVAVLVGCMSGAAMNTATTAGC